MKIAFRVSFLIAFSLLFILLFLLIWIGNMPLSFKWQIILLVACSLGGVIGIFFHFVTPRAQKHVGSMIFPLFFCTALADLCLMISDLGSSDGTTFPVINDQSLCRLYVASEDSTITQDIFFWCGIYFSATSSSWNLILAYDVLNALKNPFLPFRCNSTKNYLFVFIAGGLWTLLVFCLFTLLFCPSSVTFAVFLFPDHMILFFITVVVVLCWRDSRRLEYRSHVTTRNMVKKLLPYFVVFALQIIMYTSLYAFHIYNLEYSERVHSIVQILHVTRNWILLLLFCCDIKILQAMASKVYKKNPSPTSSNDDSNDDDCNVDVLLRKDIMRYTRMGILKSAKRVLALRESGIQNFNDYSHVDQSFIQVKGIKENVTLSFNDCAPLMFDQLRRANGIDYELYTSSFQVDDNLDEKGSEGKSGNLFYFTANRQFMVKTITESEFNTFISILPRYHKYILSNPNSLISRYFGCHSISLPVGNRFMHFVVMKYLFTCNPIQCRFDLKGNTNRRQSIPSRQIVPFTEHYIQKKPIDRLLLDIDFLRLQKKLWFLEDDKRFLNRIVKLDCEFLSNQGIIDYSILVGIQNLNPNECNGMTMSNGFISTYDSCIYYIGIIDILQCYDWKWAFQRFVLGYLMCNDIQEISAVAPTLYASRMIDFVRKVFQSKDDSIERISQPSPSSENRSSQPSPCSENRSMSLQSTKSANLCERFNMRIISSQDEESPNDFGTEYIQFQI